MRPFALLCRPRSFVPFSLMAIGLMAAPAHAAHWNITSYTCNGNNTINGGTPASWGTTQTANPATEGCGGSGYTSAVSDGTTGSRDLDPEDKQLLGGEQQAKAALHKAVKLGNGPVKVAAQKALLVSMKPKPKAP